MRITYLTLFFLLFVNGLYSQCPSVSLNLGNDTSICDGDSIPLTATGLYLGYSWNTGENTPSITVDSTGSYVCTVLQFNTTNLAFNGDFSLGDTGFTSNYIYGTGGTWGLLSNPGQYAISTNANLTHNNFANCTDNTSGTGMYMIMNGSSVANTNVWCQTIAVSPNTTYIFGAYFTSVVSNSPASLNFEVDGVAQGNVFNLSSTTCSWTYYWQTWTSGPTQTSANVCITNQNIAPSGNDFAIDDIYFGELCSASDTLDVTVLPYPNVNLGNDTVICPGGSVSIDATDDPAYTYVWSDGTQSAINTVTSTDSNLIVSVTNGSCTSTDTIIITQSAAPQVDLGPDTLLCPSDTLALGASWPGGSYVWQDNSVSDSFTVSQPGLHWVQVTDNCGTSSDSIMVSYVQFPLVDLGADTAVCAGDSFILDATYPGATYVWGGGFTNPTQTVTQTGAYRVSVTYAGCVDSDTINVQVNPTPNVNLGNDTTLCSGESYVLNVSNSGATYLWHSGSTNQIHLVNLPATYWVEVNLNGCIARDSVIVWVIQSPQLDLGADTFMCDGENIVLNAGDQSVFYEWNDGSFDSTLTVTQAGKYWVEIKNQCDTISDTVNITQRPLPSLDLGPDKTVCVGDTFVVRAGVPGATYVWHDQSGDSNFVQVGSGTVSVKVTKDGCSSIDSINVTEQYIEPIFFGNDTFWCSIHPPTLYIEVEDAEYTWSDSTTTSSSYLVQYSGKHWGTAKVGECYVSDTINIDLVPCGVILEMPNIFTPNNDGQNDEFVPIVYEGAAEINAFIYNRWGQEVFHVIGEEFMWRGTNKQGKEVPDGVYYWTFFIKNFMGEVQQYKGNVTLMR